MLYSEVHEALPRDANTDARLWPEEALQRLQQARALVDTSKYASIKEALEALDKGLDVSTDIATPLAQDLPIDPSALQETLTKLVDMVAQQNETITALSSTVATLQKQLEAPKDNDELDTRVLKLVNESLRQQNAKLEVEANKKWWQRLFNR